MMPPLQERLAGVLLGTALGDALGLPAEGMSAAAIARRFGRVDRFHLVGATGYVSDDTEQAALVAQSCARAGLAGDRPVRAFRRALLGWLLRLPFGIGLGTLRACLRIALGRRPSGVRSAGNGAAMRAAVVGVLLRERADERRRLGRALAEVTHVDARAVAGALFVAELAAACARASAGADRAALARSALVVVDEPTVRAALEQALTLAGGNIDAAAAATVLGNSGFIVHSAALATFAFVHHVGPAEATLAATIAAGGDTDSIAAIVGAWLGALAGERALPAALLARIHDGPFGPTHLGRLAAALATGAPPPRYSVVRALLRNLALYPVVLAHGLRRLSSFRRGG
jgi:ADP-ribosylglycohydrolase